MAKRKQKFAGSFARMDGILCELIAVLSNWLLLLLLLFFYVTDVVFIVLLFVLFSHLCL